MPTFSLAYTSVRSLVIPKVVKLWNDRSELKDHEWVISVDEGDAPSFAAANALSILGNVKVVVNSGDRNCNTGWNVAAESTSGKVIIAVPDDFVPPERWDTLLLGLNPQGWIDGEYVVHIDDGYVRTLCTLAILTRKRYERFGYLFYPGYQSMFTDTEFTEVAYRDGVVIYAQHLLFEHLHPDCKKRERDSVDTKHASQSRWDEGEALFNARKSAGFPLDAGPLANKNAVKVLTSDEFVAYLQVTKDDFCLFEVCKRLYEEGLNRFFFSVPDEYWSGEPTPRDGIDEVFRISESVRTLGANVEVKVFGVGKYRQFVSGDRARIAVETKVRNESLSWIRSMGYHNIVIVDGDELWFRGTLDVLKDYVGRTGSEAVACHLIPAIGLPSYPVDSAVDKATIYIGGTAMFKECRGPIGTVNILHVRGMVHFTGTRRNTQEIFDKHRRSGHYDDADYDFEGWLRNVLPNIAPGMRNAHMFKKYQVWPEVRAWRSEELAQIPQSLHRYLGFAVGRNSRADCEFFEPIEPKVAIQQA